MAEVDIEVRLRELSAVVEYPPTPDIASAVRLRLATQPQRRTVLTWRRSVALALVALLVLVLAGLAVADRLGVRGVTIVQVTSVPTALPTATGLPQQPPGSALGLGTRSSLAQARGQTSFAVAVPEPLGEPDAVYVVSSDQVSLVWAPRAGLPAAPQSSSVGLLLTEFRADIDASLFGKGVPPNATIEAVRVGASSGYFISGAPHTFFVRDQSGNLRDERSRLAGNTLLWETNGVTYRLESALGRDEAVRIAESLR